MQSLWEVLGYDELASEVAKSLRESSDITVVEGPPGVGKSFLAQGIGELWESGGGSVAVAEGDQMRSDVALYPFAYALTGLSADWKAVGGAVGGMARAAETLIGTAGIITATVQALAAAHRGQRRGRMMLLSDDEQAILVGLEELAKKPPLLLVADNLHWWDSRSLEFLGRLRNERMRDAFPFLDNIRILGVQTPEPYQSVANRQAYEALLAPIETRPIPLPRISEEKFGDVMVALGAPDKPSGQVVADVYDFSGGNLALAHQMTMRLGQGGESKLAVDNLEPDFVHKFMSERMRSLGVMGKQAAALLEVAAIVGLTFRRKELICAADADEAEAARLLRYCREEEVLRLEDENGRFVHQVFQQHFLTAGGIDKITVRERLSDCFRRFRPGEYDLRCINAIDAERSKEAAAFGVHAALQSEREGRRWKELPDRILEAIDAGGLGLVTEQLVLAHEQLRAYRFGACEEALDSLPRDDLPRSLYAESDYLRVQCLMSTRSEADREKGRGILRSWSGYVDEEPELGTRLMLLLLYGMMHLPDKQPGIELEGEIGQALTKRVEYDIAAKDALHVLDRSSGGLHPVDDSLRRVKRSAIYFGPKKGRTLVRRPVEYYRALVNLGSSQVSNGHYEEACETHGILAEYVEQFPPGGFSRLDYPTMNGYLAEYRAGRLQSDEAVVRQRQLLGWPAVKNDPFYCENALAVYLALAGSYGEALEILDRLDDHLVRTRTDPEPNMSYLIRSNRCMAKFVAGRRAEALEEFDHLAAIIPQLVFPSRPVYARRHELLLDALRDSGGLQAEELDELLLGCYRDEIGPMWKDYAHGFMLPAIEMWREN